jgi:hypothetical protein
MTNKRSDGKEYGDPTDSYEFINNHPVISIILFFLLIIAILSFAKYCLPVVIL